MGRLPAGGRDALIPVVQSIIGDGKDGRPIGDCFRACVASVFELPLEQVPHFTVSQSWFRDFKRWLARFGLTAEWEAHAPSDTPAYVPDGWWIASVRSENFDGETHAVVMRGTSTPDRDDDWLRRPAHDPSPNPRRTPYTFLGGYRFTAADPAAIARAMQAAA